MSVSYSSLVKTASSTKICLSCLRPIRRRPPQCSPPATLRSFTSSTTTLQNSAPSVKYHFTGDQTENPDKNDIWSRLLESSKSVSKSSTSSAATVRNPASSVKNHARQPDSDNAWSNLPERRKNTHSSSRPTVRSPYVRPDDSNNQQRNSNDIFPRNASQNRSPREPQPRRHGSGGLAIADMPDTNGHYNEFEQPEEKHRSRKDTRRKKDTQARRAERYELDGPEEEEYASRNVNRKQKAKKEPKASRREEKFASDEEDYTELAMRAEEEADRKAKREAKKKQQQEREEAAKALQAKQIELPAYISLSNLASLVNARFDPFVQKLVELDFTELGSGHYVHYEDASLIAMEYGFSPKVGRGEMEDLKPQPQATDRSLLPPRPPVVTIMGHVDHGKTTLLDYLRKSSVAAQEHGGITQHIGAFSVPMASGKTITFLDTPGHAAFLSMRQRGANVTDIVVLVVAADDSVKPQTIEAIKHAKSANVSIIVAINKVDKEDSDIERVKNDLLRHDITVEDFGGDVQAYPVSGLTGQGLQELVEAIDTQAEILDMRAERDGPVEGWVLEASTKKAGRVATVLVRRGILQVGDVIVAGTTWARVRTLKNEAGALVPEAPPGHPVEVDGWRDQPIAGDEVLEAPSEQRAGAAVFFRETKLEQMQSIKDMEQIQESRRLQAERHVRHKREKEQRELFYKTGESMSVEKAPVSDDGVVRATPAPKKAEPQTLYFIIKADVSGSVEAVEGSINALPLSNHPVSINILRSAVGQVSESDVDHIASVPPGQGYLVSFNQPTHPGITSDALRRGVTLLEETIIYQVIDAVRAAVEAHLPPIITRRVLGEAETVQAFDINLKKRQFMRVAGCRVRNGIVGKDRKVRVFRGGSPSINSDDNLIYEGTISTLKSHKKDVSEMRQGAECGMSFDKWEGFQAGDVIQCFEELSEPRRLT